MADSAPGKPPTGPTPDPIDDYASYNSWRVQLGLGRVSREDWERSRRMYLEAVARRNPLDEADERDHTPA